MTEEGSIHAESADTSATEPGNGEQKTGSRVVLIGLSVGAVALLIAGVVYATQMLLGNEFDALEAIPEDAHIVVTMDLLQFAESENLGLLIDTFAEPMAEAGYIDSSEVDPGAQIDEFLAEEFDINLEEDILPWVGRSTALGSWVPLDMDGVEEPAVVWSLSIRDGEAAESFVQSISDSLASEPFDDGTLYTEADQPSGLPVVWVGDELLVLATDRTLLREALDARDGASMADSETFDQVLAELPGERLALFYMGNSFFESLAETATLQSSGVPGDMEAIGDVLGAAVSVSIPDNGVRFDMVELFTEGSSAISNVSGELSGVANLPAATVGYFGSVLAEGQVRELLDQVRESDPESFDSVAQEAEEALGVDLFGEVLPSIGGEILFAVVNERDGFLAEEAGLPLGILASIGLTTTGPVNELVAQLEVIALDEGIQILRGSPSVAYADGSELLAYEVTSDALLVGSAAAIVEDFRDGVGGLTETDLYQEMDSELPGDGVSFYVDMGRVFDMFDMSAEDRAIAAPFRAVGGSYEYGDDRVTGSLLLLIDYLSD